MGDPESLGEKIRPILSNEVLFGSDLMALGLEGPQISAAQKRLACHVLEHPEDNVKEKLKRLLWNGTAE